MRFKRIFWNFACIYLINNHIKHQHRKNGHIQSIDQKTSHIASKELIEIIYPTKSYVKLIWYLESSS